MKGSATSWNPNSNGEIEYIEYSNNTVYVSGWFSDIGGESRDYLAALDSSTGLATAWSPAIDGEAPRISIDSGKVYVSGWFNEIKC